MGSVKPITLHQQVDVHLDLGGMEPVVFSKSHVVKDFIRIIQANVNNLVWEEGIIQEMLVQCLLLGAEITLGGIMELVLAGRLYLIIQVHQIMTEHLFVVIHQVADLDIM